MRTIIFRDGQSVPWPLYRGMMTGEISPQAAVAQLRREPQGGYDARPSWARRGDARLARDQGAGKLDGAYCRATDQYLRDNGVDPQDVEAVKQILDQYRDEDDDASIPIGGTRGAIGNPEPGGSQDARIAADQRLPYALRRYPTPAPSTKQAADFASRYPHAAKIKVL